MHLNIHRIAAAIEVESAGVLSAFRSHSFTAWVKLLAISTASFGE